MYLCFRDEKKKLRMIETEQDLESLSSQMELRKDIFDGTGIITNLPILGLIIGEKFDDGEKKIA